MKIETEDGEQKMENGISCLERRDFIKAGLYVGGALLSSIAVPRAVFAASPYLDEHFTLYDTGQQIISNPNGGGTTNWELWFLESDFVGQHPCNTMGGGDCRMLSPVVGSFPEMGPPFNRTARMDPAPDLPTCSVAHFCNGGSAPTPCEYRHPGSYTNHPCKLWNCSRAAKTIALVPANRHYYQAYVDVAFNNIDSLRYPADFPLWDHLGVFIHVKRQPAPPPGSNQMDWARFGCCVRPAPNLGASQCFLQTTNPENPYYTLEHDFALPGGSIQNQVMYTLGVSITPFGFDALTARAAVQNHATGAITEKLFVFSESSVNWITNPSVGIGYTSNCGAKIHIDKVVAENLP